MSFFAKKNFRDSLVAIFTFLGGIYFFLFFILPEQYLESLHIKQSHEDISLGFISIGLLTFGLGIINLFMIHGGKIIYLKKGWGQSLALIGSMIIMIVFSCLDWKEDYIVQKKSAQLNLLFEFSKAIQTDIAAERKDVPEPEKRLAVLKEEIKKLVPEDSSENLAKLSVSTSPPKEAMPQFIAALNEALSLKKEKLMKESENSVAKKGYKFLFEGLFVSLGSALFSLLGVYIAAAAYRAFRIKTWESSLMMFAALIVMLGQISYGTLLYEDMPLIRGWLLEVPNSAVSRAITIGSSVAGLVLAFRMWFSIESDSFSSKKDK